MPSHIRPLILLTPRHRQQFLQDLITGQRKPELGGRSQHTRWPAFKEGAKSFFLPYAPCTLPEGSVFRFALSGFDLQAGFYDVAGSGEVGGWHAGNSARGEELYDAEFLGLAFAEEIAFEVVVGREVDS